MNDNDFSDFLDELEDGHAYYLPELIEIDTFEEFEEILNSEEFENYVRLLADSNPFYVRNGFALQGPNFLRNCSILCNFKTNISKRFSATSGDRTHFVKEFIGISSCFRRRVFSNI